MNQSSHRAPAPQQSDSEVRVGLDTPPESPWPTARARWMLDPQIDFLNHGSFGALPRSVEAAQSSWRRRIEARPIELLGRECGALLKVARQAVGALVGADADDLGFVTNATEGINAYLNGLALESGDEVLTTDHVYNAVRQAIRHRVARSGAALREISIALPVDGPATIVDAIRDALGPRTRLVVIDHVTSPTAIRFPVEQIASLCAERGVELLVDGAHAPGMLELDLRRLAALGVTGYAANLHKWVCAPKGSAFLWVRPDRQASVHPVVVSHFLDQGFRAEFDWQGTRDITPWLCAADAILFLEEFGLRPIMEHNAAMARWVQRHCCTAWGVSPISPADGSMLGSMTTVPLPPALQPDAHRVGHDASDPRRRGAAERFQVAFVRRFAIEVPLVDFGGRWHLRPCCQIYNDPQQYHRLASAIDEFARESDRADGAIVE